MLSKIQASYILKYYFDGAENFGKKIQRFFNKKIALKSTTMLGSLGSNIE
jgi:hypothetical protein